MLSTVILSLQVSQTDKKGGAAVVTTQVFWDEIFTISLAIMALVVICFPAIIQSWSRVIETVKAEWGQWKEERDMDRRFQIIETESEKSHEAL